MDEKIIPHLVARFLSWKLPSDFHPDAGISFAPNYNNGTPEGGRHEPTGTNLLNAEQAFALVRHLLDHPAAIEAMGQDPELGWQPIETAPKDGLILADWSGETRLTSWKSSSATKSFRWAHSDGLEWTVYRMNEPQPTSWRPLPAPPADPRAQQTGRAYWLVERNDLGAAQYRSCSPRYDWTTIAGEALQFARREDAHCYIHRHEGGDPVLKAVEHADMPADPRVKEGG